MIAQISTAVALLAGSAAAAPTINKRVTSAALAFHDSPDNCLVVEGSPKNDAKLISFPCNKKAGSPRADHYGSWDIVRGDQTTIRLTGTDFCLDAGLNENDRGQAKIYQCYPGASQQAWTYTDDDHVAVTGGSQCLGADYYGSLITPVYRKCGEGAPSTQQWTVKGGSEPLAPPKTPEDDKNNDNKGPSGEIGRRIRLDNDGNKCLTVGGKIENGAPLITEPCEASKNANQMWYIQRGQDAIRLVNSDFCVDYGLNPGNGVGGKIWQCYNGSPQQANYYTDDDHLALAGGSVCLDAKAGSNQVQQWQCIGGNTNQIWKS